MTGEATVHERIVAAAAALLESGGRDAVSTRAVCAAAQVQAPTLYRLFGDKRGLLDAVAAHGFASYLAEKHGPDRTADPVDSLRVGWDLHVDFGLAHPALYSLMYGDPRPGAASPAARAAADVLASHVHAIALAGRLGMPEGRAAQLVHAAGCGTTFTLLEMHEPDRDPALSVTAREAVITAITLDAPATAAPGPVGAAVALRAALPRTTALTPHEAALMRDWLDRIAGT